MSSVYCSLLEFATTSHKFKCRISHAVVISRQQLCYTRLPSRKYSLFMRKSRGLLSKTAEWKMATSKSENARKYDNNQNESDAR